MNVDQIIGMIVGGLYVFTVVWEILKFISYWKVFTKAGQPGWKSFIPFYNLYIEYKFTWKANMCWLVILLLMIGGAMSNSESMIIALLGIVLMIVGSVVSFIGDRKLAASFGHGVGFTIGLYFLAPIFTMILAFGKSRYIGIVEKSDK